MDELKTLEMLVVGLRGGSPSFHPSQVLQSGSFELADAAYTMT